MDVFDFSEFPILTTGRLVLRQHVPADAPDVFVIGADPEVQKYNAKPMTQVSQAADFIQELADSYASKQGIYWAITLKEVDQVIGDCGYNYWSRNHNRAWIGYTLAQAHWGQGIGGEAVAAMIRFGFERMNLNRIEATTIADNHGSVRMLEKLGFQGEGLRRSHSREDDGRYHDGAIYGLLRREFME